jgi:ligand-binding sensor protein
MEQISITKESARMFAAVIADAVHGYAIAHPEEFAAFCEKEKRKAEQTALPVKRRKPKNWKSKCAAKITRIGSRL